MGQYARDNAEAAGENAIGNLQCIRRRLKPYLVSSYLSLSLSVTHPHVLLQEENVLEDMLKLRTAACIGLLDMEIQMQANEH